MKVSYEVQGLRGKNRAQAGLTVGHSSLHGMRQGIPGERVPGRDRQRDVGGHFAAVLQPGLGTWTTGGAASCTSAWTFRN